MEAMTAGERRRILKLFADGWSSARIAQAIGRSESGVRRIRQRYRERGHVQPLKRGNGRPPRVTAQDRQHLKRLVEQQPDATLIELMQRSGLSVSRTTIHRHLHQMKLCFKKK